MEQSLTLLAFLILFPLIVHGYFERTSVNQTLRFVVTAHLSVLVWGLQLEDRVK